jgi:uncharacterized RDD family membrane protein YckC
MECRYCQATNAEDDHRCRRCGRRLRMTPVYTGNSAAAPALRFDSIETNAAPQGATNPALALEPTAPPAARRPPTYQPSLFSARELPRVVPFETFAPESVQTSPRKSVGTPRPRQRKVIPGQQSLEFTTSRPVEGVIYCDAPVAIPAHRAMAAALDASVILIALGIFVAIFMLAGGQLVFNAQTAIPFIFVAGSIAILYKLLWCLGNGDTAGMRWTNLRLVNFDGQAPDRKHRIYRMASGALSIAAAGLGMLWALVDEETLTWHDHISRTFPSPY